jgi:hypothetical protein
MVEKLRQGGGDKRLLLLSRKKKKKIIKTQGAGVWIGGPITWKEVRKRVLLGDKKMNSKKGDSCDEDAAPCIG